MRAFDSRSPIPTRKTVSSVEVKYLRFPTASAAMGVCNLFRMQGTILSGLFTMNTSQYI
jgi:hypothetical protein